MGQQLNTGIEGCRGCQQEEQLFETDGCPNSSRLAQIQCLQDTAAGYGMTESIGDDWHCVRAEDGPHLEVVNTDLLESLSYSPTSYDAATTIDTERSQARYSNILVHGSRARLTRRSKVWEDWLQAAIVGRNILVLSGFPGETPRRSEDPAEASSGACKRMPGRYSLDRALTTMSVVPVATLGQAGDTPPALLPPWDDDIVLDSIQVICTATDFKLFADEVASQLSADDSRRAVLLQYRKGGPNGEQRRLCFLETTQQDKDRFVQGLTSLWLEKRNNDNAPEFC